MPATGWLIFQYFIGQGNGPAAGHLFLQLTVIWLQGVIPIAIAITRQVRSFKKFASIYATFSNDQTKKLWSWFSGRLRDPYKAVLFQNREIFGFRDSH